MIATADFQRMKGFNVNQNNGIQQIRFLVYLRFLSIMLQFLGRKTRAYSTSGRLVFSLHWQATGITRPAVNHGGLLSRALPFWATPANQPLA
jgi:hypothetical protein